MKALSALFLLAPLVAAAPASEVASPRALNVPTVVPQNVRIVGVSLLGSGCPAGTADVQIDATKTLLEVTFSEYIIQTGPGTMAADWRKNCKLTLNMEFDEGFQYVPHFLLSTFSYVNGSNRTSRFATLSTDTRGFAQIPQGSRGLCSNTFDFTGTSEQSTYSISLIGPREGPFSLTADPDVTSWSPCGGTTAIMNMNTQCNISPTRSPALIAVSTSRQWSRNEKEDVPGKETLTITGINRSIESAARLLSMCLWLGASAEGEGGGELFMSDQRECWDPPGGKRAQTRAFVQLSSQARYKYWQDSFIHLVSITYIILPLYISRIYLNIYIYIYIYIFLQTNTKP